MCRDRPGLPSETWHCPTLPGLLVRTKWPEQTVLRREREGREKEGALGGTPSPPSISAAPGTSDPEAPAVALALRAQLEAQPACARGTCVPVCPPHPLPFPPSLAPMLRWSLSPSTLVAWPEKAVRVWGPGLPPACLLGAGRVPGLTRPVSPAGPGGLWQRGSCGHRPAQARRAFAEGRGPLTGPWRNRETWQRWPLGSSACSAEPAEMDSATRTRLPPVPGKQHPAQRRVPCRRTEVYSALPRRTEGSDPGQAPVTPAAVTPKLQHILGRSPIHVVGVAGGRMREGTLGSFLE